MPLLERARVAVYIPDLHSPQYRNLLLSFEEEFTYAFGGCTIITGLDGNYLSDDGLKIQDSINLIFSDLPVALSRDFEKMTAYASQLRTVAFEALAEESVLVTVEQIYHAL